MLYDGRAFVAECERVIGARYVFGAKPSWSDPKPAAFDCSGLVRWALRRLGVAFPDGSRNQYEECRRTGKQIALPVGVRTPGALLFRMTGNPTHVAVSRGDGTTIEARGARYGVNRFPAGGRGWTAAGLVPGLITTEVDMLLARDPAGRIYLLGPTGKRYIGSPAELRWYEEQGLVQRTIPQDVLDGIPIAVDRP